MNFNTLNLLRSYSFGVGGSHNVVRTIKTFLNSHPAVKVSDLKQDTLFDSKTQTALAQFQRLKGLKPTGVTDLKTWLAIGAEMNPISIQAASMGNQRLRDLLGLGYVSKHAHRKSLTNISFDSVIRTSSALQAGTGA